MHFCDKCDNMLYLKVRENDEDNLLYYCRNCGNTSSVLEKEDLCVLKTNFTNMTNGYLYDVNSYTKLDPTLPRTKNIKCPNSQCESNTDKKDNEVIYLRYNDVEMQYVYMCAICDKLWKTTEN